MSEHKLSTGKRVIDGLCALGAALGYHVRREFTVAAESDGPQPAVDVAWFSDDRDEYPLMIFEVESRAGNTIANNPLKVFAQDSKSFEKPLFYFQLIVEGAGRTRQIELLERQYGTYNYRLYRLGRDEGTQLVRDVLRQHRRIRINFDYVLVFEVLSNAHWAGFVDAAAVLNEAFSLGLSGDDRLQGLIRLGRMHPIVRNGFADVVEEIQRSDWKQIGHIRTFIGQQWAPVILASWMIGEAKSEEEVSAWDERLLKWQNETSFMPMFCSDLALSHEYAEFLLGLGGPFVAVLVGLARGRGSFGAQFLRVLLETLERVPPTWRGLQVALWACHVAARLVMQPEFEKASQFINDIGGVAATDLTQPPSFVSVTELGQDEQFSLEDMLLCPAMPEFLAMLRRPFGIDKDRTDLMLTVLDDDTFFYRWNVPVCDVLWSEPWAG